MNHLKKMSLLSSVILLAACSVQPTPTTETTQTQQSTQIETTLEETTQAPVVELDHEFLYEGLNKKPATTEFQPVENKLVLRSVGDVLLHDRVSVMADTTSDLYNQTKSAMIALGFNEEDFNASAEFDFSPMLNFIKPYIEFADVSVANMEIIAAYPQLPISGYPQFNAPKEILSNLKSIGIDIMSNATNHTLDWSSEGAHASLQNMQEVGMMYYGSYDSWEDYKTPRIIEKNGIKLGFLAYSYGTNGVPIPDGEEYLINLIDLQVMLREVEILKSQVDAVVVSLQLGGEYDPLPNDEQFQVYQALSDAGVKLILGGHPHTLQPFDWYNEDQTFAIYSQASFLTGQRELENKIGGITEVTFTKDANGNVKVENPKFMPIFNLGVEAEKMYQVVPLADIVLHQIPEGQTWWDLINERMKHFLSDANVVTHLETGSTFEDQDIMR